jgi:hypothetical protein
MPVTDVSINDIAAIYRDQTLCRVAVNRNNKGAFSVSKSAVGTDIAPVNDNDLFPIPLQALLKIQGVTNVLLLVLGSENKTPVFSLATIDPVLANSKVELYNGDGNSVYTRACVIPKDKVEAWVSRVKEAMTQYAPL